jgi:hypothetical protein
MAKRRAHSFASASCRAMFSLCAPRLSFLKTKRFWVWTISTYLSCVLAIAACLAFSGVAPFDSPGIFLVAIVVAMPAQIVGMMIHWLLDRRRAEQRGFSVVMHDKKAA